MRCSLEDFLKRSGVAKSAIECGQVRHRVRSSPPSSAVKSAIECGLSVGRADRGMGAPEGDRLVPTVEFLTCKSEPNGTLPAICRDEAPKALGPTPDNLTDRRSPVNPAQRAAEQCSAITTKSLRTARRFRRPPCVVVDRLYPSERFAKSHLRALSRFFRFSRRRIAPRAARARRGPIVFRRPADRSPALSGSRRRRRNAPSFSRPRRIGAETAPR